MVSIVLLIENGGSGGKVAAPVAGNAFEFIFSKKNFYINNVKNSI